MNISKILSSAAILTLILSTSTFDQDLHAEEKTSQTKTAEECYKEKDQACLKKLFSTILKKRTKDKEKAIYLLGLLQLKDGKDLTAAKDTFIKTLMFGGKDHGAAAIKELNKLYKSGKVEFKTTDCLVIKNEACFYHIINGNNPEAARNARYLLGKRIYETDPKRSFKLLKEATDAGHQSAECELAQFYTDNEEKDGIPMDYHQSITYGIKCLFKPPFKKFDRKHFSKYQKKEGNKAYVKRSSGYANFIYSRTSPDIAARTALKICEAFSTGKSKEDQCKVINVNGKWVKNPKMADFNKLPNGIKILVSNSAKKSYLNKYSKAENPKAFAQSPIGAWHWYTKTDTGLSLEKLKEKALKSCNKVNTVIKTKQSCKLVNVNGQWVQ